MLSEGFGRFCVFGSDDQLFLIAPHVHLPIIILKLM